MSENAVWMLLFAIGFAALLAGFWVGIVRERRDGFVLALVGGLMMLFVMTATTFGAHLNLPWLR